MVSVEHVTLFAGLAGRKADWQEAFVAHGGVVRYTCACWAETTSCVRVLFLRTWQLTRA